jgi:hypothetical protein
MPLAARADRKNRCGALGCKTSLRVEGEDEHPPSSLRHSEVLSVENSVSPHVPEFFHATDERPKIPTAIAGEESRYVLEEERGRSVSLHKVEEREGEDAALSCEPGSLSSDAEVLAGEAAGPEGCSGPTTIIWRSLIGFAASIALSSIV